MKSTNSNNHEEKAEAGVWGCKDCGKFHVKAGKVSLTLIREEFYAFVNENWDCFYSQEFDLALAN